MKTGLNRIRKDIETLAQFTATPGAGVTRLPFTPEDLAAKKYIKEQMLEAGLSVTEDGVGTVIGRMEGGNGNAPAIMIGSHYDSVRNGGAFDGAAGVAAALETARVLFEEKVKLGCPVEIVAMNDEEGVRFGTGMMSSRAMVGEMPEDELDTARDASHMTVREAMRSIGLEPALQKAARNMQEIKAFLELHIEQGPLLEARKAEIGIVESIVGLSSYKIIINGRAGHAGTTPMHLRADALLAASEVVLFVNSAAVETNCAMVATVGEMRILPNASNVIPGTAEFTVDVRSSDEADIEKVCSGIMELLKRLEQERGVTTQFSTTFCCKPVILSKRVKDAMKKEAAGLGYSCLAMSSGAGHDSMVMANYTDAGMIFVPSKNGISHTPEEWTDYEDLQKGAEVLLNTVISLGTEI